MLWVKDEYLKGIKDFQDVKLLSLDVFDTLLFRAIDSPTKLFFELGRKAIEKGLLFRCTPYEFQQVRILAEQERRRLLKKTHNITEVNLEKIYESMPKIGNLQKIMELELELETKHCYLNPSIFSLVKEFHRNNVPIVLTSDMYLSAKQIENILVHIGFPIEYITHIYVSNEYGYGKENGMIFRDILNDFPDVLAHEILHIGDNYQADVKGAECAGVKAVHYKIIPVDIDSVFEWEKVRYGEYLGEITSFRKLAGALCEGYSGKERFWFQFGATILGPFLSLFVDWVIESCREKKGIYPLMREGHLLSQMFKKSIEHKGLDIDIKPLYVSRRATYFPSITEVNHEEVKQIIEGTNPNVHMRNVTLYNFFSMLDILEDDEIKSLNNYYEIYLLDSGKTDFVHGISLQKKLVQLLTQEKFLRKINDIIEKNRTSLISYLQETLTSFENVATVDIGFQGTIQSYLEKTLKNANIPFDITHFLGFGTERTREKIFGGMDIRGFVGSAGENLEIVRAIRRSPEIFEELLMGEEGSTIGYEFTKGKSIPVTEKNHCTAEELEWKYVCHQGALVYQELWLNFCKQKSYLYKEILSKRKEAGMILSRVIEMPSIEEAECLGRLTHDDNFGSDHADAICSDEAKGHLEKLGIEKFLEYSKHGWDSTKSCWPQGTATNAYPFYIYQYFLKHNQYDVYLSAMSEMMQKISEQGQKEVIIYGAGEAGKKLSKLALLHQVKVRCFVDRNESLWGNYIDGIAILSLDEAVKLDTHVYAIGSVAYKDEIIFTIKKSYEKVYDMIPKIFSVYS